MDSERHLGFGGAGLIPWRAVRDWAQFYGANRDETIVIVAAISYLDARRLEQLASKESLK